MHKIGSPLLFGAMVSSLAAVGFTAAGQTVSASSSPHSRETLLLDPGWQFHRFDPLRISYDPLRRGKVKSLDTTRPVTAAQNGGQLNRENVAQVLDVVGINYQVDKYSQIRAAYLNKPILSTEDTSQVMTRGAYATDWSGFVLAVYDDRYPGWDSTNRSAWEAIARQPAFGDGFIWTGFDYRGDPTSHEPDKGMKRSLFNGLAQVILQSQRGGSGNLVLRAKAAGLTPAETTITVTMTMLPPSVPVVTNHGRTEENHNG